MNANISSSRDIPYLSPKPSKSPLTKFPLRASRQQSQPIMLSPFKYINTEANPELSKPMAESAHHIGANNVRNQFVVHPLIKKVEEFTITSGSGSQSNIKQQFMNNQVTKSPKFLIPDKTSMTNRSRKMSYNQQSVTPHSPKVNYRKSEFVTNSDTLNLQLPQTRDRKLSYQVSAQSIPTQPSFTKKEMQSYWPMSPTTETSRRQSDLLHGMASGRNNFFQDHYFLGKNHQNGSSTNKITNLDQAKHFFPSFKNSKFRKNSQNQNNPQKDAKNQLPSFLLKKMHKQNEDTKPQQNIQILKEDRQKQPQILSLPGSGKQKKFSLKDFVLIKQLGEGKFGKVLLVRQKGSGFICAMKVFKKSQIEADNFIQQFIREMKIQMFLNHPNIIKMYGYFDDLSFIYILLEVAIEGTLYSFLQTNNKKQKMQAQVPSNSSVEIRDKKQGLLTGLSLKQIAVIMYQICSGISYLHSHNIIHRDLKPQNVVMHQVCIPLTKKTIKLCDFGWSVFKGSQMRTTFCGTPLYLCPQLITGQQYDQKVDIWAIGIMLYEFLIGPNPFNIKKQADLANIIHQSVSLDKNDVGLRKRLDSSVIDFINGCLNKDPIERLDIREIVNHEFFKKYCSQVMTNPNASQPRNSNLGMGEMMKS